MFLPNEFDTKRSDIIKKQYNLTLKKGKQTKKVVVKPNGDMLANL